MTRITTIAIIIATITACDLQAPATFEACEAEPDLDVVSPRGAVIPVAECGLNRIGSPVHALAQGLVYCDDAPSWGTCVRAAGNLFGATPQQAAVAVEIHEAGCVNMGPESWDQACIDLMAIADQATGPTPPNDPDAPTTCGTADPGPECCAFAQDDFDGCFAAADPTGTLSDITVAALCGALVLP